MRTNAQPRTGPLLAFKRSTVARTVRLRAAGRVDELADYQAPRIRYIFPSAASAAFWGVEVRTGWLSLAGKSQDWAGRESFAVGDEMGLAYDAAAGSLQVFKQSRLLGTAVASGGLPGAGELVWAVAMMGADPSYDDEGQVVRLCLL